MFLPPFTSVVLFIIGALSLIKCFIVFEKSWTWNCLPMKTVSHSTGHVGRIRRLGVGPGQASRYVGDLYCKGGKHGEVDEEDVFEIDLLLDACPFHASPASLEAAAKAIARACAPGNYIPSGAHRN